ncbi:hypothetical protein R1flu_027026 [Riccia fluitans]|uniref:Uncharacterized protein n=1 Tax=Riccia fluitans TaxID=41844 RepID=A0ABD1XHL5_9MARC
MAEQSGRKAHALRLPAWGQGHIAPVINVGLRLATNGITSTFVNVRKNISSIRSKYEKELRGLDFHLVQLDDEPGRRELRLGPIIQETRWFPSCVSTLRGEAGSRLASRK